MDFLDMMMKARAAAEQAERRQPILSKLTAIVTECTENIAKNERRRSRAQRLIDMLDASPDARLAFGAFDELCTDDDEEAQS